MSALGSNDSALGLLVLGGNGDDVLTGGPRPNVILGRRGNDTISGNGGNDVIDGGSGHDTIAGGAGNDLVSGGDGNDTVLWKAGDGNDVVHGGRGADTFVVTTSDTAAQTVRVEAGSNGKIIVRVEGGAGGGVITLDSIEDLKFVVGSGGATIIAGPGIVLPPLNIAGSDGVNVIDQSGTTQSAVIDAGGGDDVVLAGDDADTIAGGVGNDYIDGGLGADTIDAGSGDDEVVWNVGDGNDAVQGGAGTDQLEVSLAATTPSTLVVSADALGNVVLASEGERITADGIEQIVINAGAGGSIVTIGSLAGTDVSPSTVHFVGDAGTDVLDGTLADRRIAAQGNGGNDALHGGSAGDSLDGGAGDDMLRGNAGDDVLDGGEGNDTLDYSTDPAGVLVDLSTGTANDGFGGTDTFRGIENADGSSFADTITGNEAANVLAGVGGNDTLRGNAGADTIDGGAGDDSITGGAGDDTLTGGAGADRYFVVDPGQTAVNNGNDTITDFVAGDVIDLTPVASITSLAQLLAASRQEGADTVIDLGDGNSIRLAGVALGSLTAASFVFATPPIVGTANADSLQGTAGNDTILGLGGNDSLTGLAGSDVLDGGEGADAALYVSDPGPIIANLSANPIAVDGVTVQSNTVRDSTGNTDTLISVEGVVGTNQADTLIGGDGQDTLSGFGGADTIDGGDGNDIIVGGGGIDFLDGGAGFDIAFFGGDPAVLGGPLLQISIDSDGSITSVNTRTGETETDIVNFEMVFGSLGNDVINGTNGNDFLGGSFGSDAINGGAGIDTVVYTFNAGTVLTIDLASGTSSEIFTPAVGPPGLPPQTFTAADTLLGIENVRGSASGETIIGNSGDNVLEGGAGNDVLRGGAGNDTLNGGASVLLTHPEAVIAVEIDGTDTADYSTDGPAGVTVNLLTGVATDSTGGTDTLLSMENANGSAFNDTIIGNDAANVLSGLGGNDNLRGNAGADALAGGDGNDSITGGAGNDTLTGGAGGDRYFLVDPGQTAVNIDNDTIADFVPGDVIDLTPVASITSLSQLLAISRQEGADAVIDLGGGNSIRLTGVALGSLTAANFVFAGGPQFPPGSIVGTEGNEGLSGTPGADQIFGLGGNDSLNGGAGDDLLDGGDGTDSAIYLTDTGPIVANLSAAPITVGGITVQPNTVRDGIGSIDTLIGIEGINLVGPASNGADTLIGSAGDNALAGGGGADTIFGGDGLDTISGGAGIDIMDGGAGFDIVLFSGDAVPINGPGLRITVNADGSITSIGATETEANLPNFEMLSGSQGNDIITGNAGDNMLGGGFGSDIIDGGAGIDTVNYQFSFPTAGSVLTVDLAAGTSSETLTSPPIPLPVGPPIQTFTASDTLINIENVSGTTGVDHISGDAGNNVLQGFLGDDRLRGGAGDDTLDGNVFTLFTHLENTGPSPLDGSDTADYATDPNGVNVNLSTGLATDGHGDTDTLVSIENVTGSAFGDTLTGNDLANMLDGLAGADTLKGGAGDDRLVGGAGIDVVDGGDGFDIVDYSADAIAASAPGLSITIDGNTVTSVNAALEESEVAMNVEAIIGSLGDDTVTGGAGDDTYIAGAGDDQFDGGAGSDTVRFGTAVVVDLDLSFVQGVDGSLALTGIENLTGSASADTLRGNAAANVLIGGLGDDVLAGRGGADTLIGGTPGAVSTDFDTVDYSDDGGSVDVNLATGTAVDGGGANDTLVGIERAIGSQFADTLIGDGGNNVLTGLGGHDVLTGGAGVDTFVTTADAAGNAAFGNDTVTDFNVAQDFVSLRAFPSIRSFADVQARLTQDGADAVVTVSAGNSVRLQNVNAASLTANNFLLLNLNIIGTDAAETLTGGIGDDTIQGRGGNDTLLGLEGNDTLDGGLGTDTLNGGPGNDTLLDQDTFGTTMIGGAGNDAITGGIPDYATDPGAIVANLSTASFDVNGNGSLIVASRTVRDGYGGTDTLAGTISTLEASYFNDTVVGSANSETLFLYAGNDRALGMDGSDTFWGGSGDDHMDGGAGLDTINYSLAADDGGAVAPNQGIRLNLSAVSVDIGGGVVLSANSAIDQYGDRDSVFNIELAGGSLFGDVIVGSATTISLSGFDGNDTLLGGSGNESLTGGAGNDIIDGGGGTDSATFGGSSGAIVNLLTQTASDGQGGADVIRNVENVSGGQFADDLTGDDNNNNLNGNAGNDILRGNAGADFLDGGDGNDVLEGGASNDQLNGGRNNDVLTGGAGADTFAFMRNAQPTLTDFGVDVITDFSVVDDLLNVSNVPELTSIDAVLARATANGQGVLITINVGNSIQLNGLTLADLPLMRFSFSPIVGTAGDDVLEGTGNGENINGFGGNDVINGRGGSDFLDGGDGNDTVNGGDGDDNLLGNAGNDVLNGEVGNDFLDAGSGDDTLTGGGGADGFRSTRSGTGSYGRDVFTDFSVTEDRLDLGGITSMTSRDALNAASAQVGLDVVITIDPASSITLRNVTLAQLAAANVTFAPFAGTPGNDVLNGSSGNDSINGLGGDDTLNGNGGNDSLFGGDGNDVLNGGAGDDFMDAGSGDDTLTGATGSDAFRSARSAAAGNYGRDVYTDFSVAEDRLDLGGIASMTSRDALNAAAVQVGPDVVITIDPTSSITLRNLTLAQLAAANVTFAPFNGTPGNDTLNGSSGNDFIVGLGGDDLLNGNAGNDTLIGSDGNDTLDGGEGNDSLNGDLGNDILSGGLGQDSLHGGVGNDTLTGGSESDYFNMRDGGQDVVTDLGVGDTLDLSSFPSMTSRAALAAASVQAGPNVVITTGITSSITLQGFTLAQLALANVILAPLNGTNGNDVLNGTDSGEVINGLGGDDNINGLAGGDSIFGGDGNDTLNGGADGDYVSGGNGNDILVGEVGFDTLEGGPGDDSLTGGADTDFFRMQSGRDTITDFAGDVLELGSIPTMTSRAALMAAAQQAGTDVVITVGPNDVITLANFTLEQLAVGQVQFAPFVGTEGNDVLNGTDGNDVIQARGGDDVLNGADGNDQLFGDDGNDTLNGDAGFDSLTPGRGNDTVDGGDSLNDYIDFGFNATTGAVVDLAAGTATNDGTGGVDVISNIENVYGTSLNDTIAGDAGNNSLHGFVGNDVLFGRGGEDNINGYDGDDTLTGGTGNDFLWGGDGDDLFLFATGDGVDVITSFEAGAGSNDVIDLQGLAGFDSFTDVEAATTEDVFGAVIDLGGGNRLTLQGVSESALHADDFLL